MGTRSIAPAVGIVAAVLLLVGCGSDSSTSTSSITKVAFIKKADGVCQGGNKRMEAGFADFLNANKDVKRPTRADYEGLVKTVVVPNLKQEVKAIRTLAVPSGDEDWVDAIVTAMEEGIETAENDPEVAVTSSQAVYGVSSRLATEYGLKVCGSR